MFIRDEFEVSAPVVERVAELTGTDIEQVRKVTISRDFTGEYSEDESILHHGKQSFAFCLSDFAQLTPKVPTVFTSLTVVQSDAISSKMVSKLHFSELVVAIIVDQQAI